MADVTPIRRLDSDQIETAPMLYLAALVSLATESIGELADAIDAEDKAVARAACVRLTSIGALAGIVGAKL